MHTYLTDVEPEDESDCLSKDEMGKHGEREAYGPHMFFEVLAFHPDTGKPLLQSAG